jgi:uncharacterized membrane protein YeaQ/YmgE (transglycosylase-associated protein family)
MSFLQFLVLVVVAAICGAIGQSLAGYSLGGCLVSAVVGFLGALIGVWLARGLGLPEWLIVNIDGENFPIVWSIIGSTLLALLLGLVSRRRGWSY